MFAFGRKKSARLGVDIGSTAIKLVELSQAKGTGFSAIHLENYVIEPLPINAVAEKKIANVQAVGATIRKAVARSGTRVERAATALPGSSVITKVISMSAVLSDAEMEVQLRLESDQHIPYPLEEVNIDFAVLGPSDADDNLVDVLLAASRRENVDDRVATIEIGGLSAAIIDVEAYTMESVCPLLPGTGERTVATVDIGAAATTLHVLHEGRTVYTREQGFGGRQLIEEVQRHYGLDYDQALRRVIEDDLPDSYATEILDPFKEILAQQIGRALQLFYSTGIFNHVDRIVLAGGVAGIRGIDASLAERLGITTGVANPFTDMSRSSGIESAALNRDAPAMMIAAGLALRGFD